MDSVARMDASERAALMRLASDRKKALWRRGPCRRPEEQTTLDARRGVFPVVAGRLRVGGLSEAPPFPRRA